MKVVDDDDQVVGFAPQIGLSRLQVEHVGLQRQAARARLGAQRGDLLGVVVDRAHREAALGQEERVPAAATGDVEGATGAGNQIEVGEEPG